MTHSLASAVALPAVSAAVAGPVCPRLYHAVAMMVPAVAAAVAAPTCPRLHQSVVAAVGPRPLSTMRKERLI